MSESLVIRRLEALPPKQREAALALFYHAAPGDVPNPKASIAALRIRLHHPSPEVFPFTWVLLHKTVSSQTPVALAVLDTLRASVPRDARLDAVLSNAGFPYPTAAFFSNPVIHQRFRDRQLQTRFDSVRKRFAGWIGFLGAVVLAHGNDRQHHRALKEQGAVRVGHLEFNGPRIVYAYRC